MSIIVNVDVMMAKRKMSSGELAEKIGITQANLSVLKTGKAKAVRFSTLEQICRVLDCQPGDIVETNDGWHKVTDQRMTGIKEIVKVKTQLGCDIRCTPNHLFYARKMYHKWNNDRRQYDRLFEQPT